MRAKSLCLLGLSVLLFASPVAAAEPRGVEGEFRIAQSNSDISEKDAFESAKELGTLEAWEAFLNNFPTGFRADLARAYVRRIGTAAPKPSAPANSPAVARPPVTPAQIPVMRPSIGRIERAPASSRDVQNRPNAARLGCQQRGALRSSASTSPARISFINFTKAPYEVFWIDYDGQQQLYGEIAPDRQASVETFVTHPWMISDLSGNCITMAMPNPGPQVFVVGSKSVPPPKTSSSPKTKPKKPKKSGSSCGSGKIRIEGKCLTRKEAIGYCGPGFRPVRGRCIHQNELQKNNRPKCPKGQVWNSQEGCHYDD